ncbi:hypothetical protein V7S43_009363 [Phytophthora oleae]|uniref:Uncharacterized protein n=1 Tax=Phytophthora oleae TaxID=2107226 RepID=A0ABD3FHY9_9STRA
MVRRNVLSGASSWEREEKANQQRDYAAQLQEQVLQKQAKQEQEKARRRQEQREETELLERERAAATRKLQPQQEPAAPDPVPPAASPQRSVSMPHTSTIDLQQHTVPTASTLQSASVGPGFISVGINPGAPMTGSAVFKSAPSIFESLLREPGIGARSSAFYDDLAALQRLAVELDSAAKQKRATAQNNYVKPNFLHQEETEATSTNATSTPLSSPVKLLSPVKLPSPMKFDDEKVEIQAKNQHHQPKARCVPHSICLLK